MNANHDRIRRARGPLTGIALLCIGASVAVYFTATSGNGASSLVATSVSVNTNLAQDPSATDPSTTMATPSSAPVTSQPPAESSTTRPASTTQAPTTSTPPPSSTRPAATTSTTTAPTTTKAPQPVSWRNVIPPLPGGGSAKLIEQTSTRYAVSIEYPSYASSALSTDFTNAFKSAGWTASATGNTVTVSKGNVQGTAKITASGGNSSVVLDLRSVA